MCISEAELTIRRTKRGPQFAAVLRAVRFPFFSVSMRRCFSVKNVTNVVGRYVERIYYFPQQNLCFYVEYFQTPHTEYVENTCTFV